MLYSTATSTRYFKRYRMECDLAAVPAQPVELPDSYFWQAWSPAQVERHALVKFISFRSEVDADVFPCLGEYAGCSRLMRDISQQPSFVPEATWLIVHEPRPGMLLDCGTVQGVAQSAETGAIQNVGVSPEFRSQGLGRALVLRCLQGFRQVAVRRVSLEVTAANRVAVDLYESVGFRRTRTMYRAVVDEQFAS